MKKISHEVVNSGGIVRAIHNHGIRDLPHRFKARFPDKEGNRYYRKGRFISIYYDSNPATMQQVDQILTMDEEILRNSHLKARSILDYVNIAREDRNPLMRKVRGMQRQETAQSFASKRWPNRERGWKYEDNRWTLFVIELFEIYHWCSLHNKNWRAMILAPITYGGTF